MLRTPRQVKCFQAVTCHRAGAVRVQSFRNKCILPGEKKAALERRWENLRCLVLEEVSMISPAQYSMLLFRSFHGRRDRWKVKECEYDKTTCAFGRMPIVLHLGDFLQKKPVASFSLIENLKERERLGLLAEDFPPEFQMAMKLFCATPFCFELRASNRIKEPKLRSLMEYIREPSKRIPSHIKEY